MNNTKVDEIVNRLRIIAQEANYHWYEPLVTNLSKKKILLEWWYKNKKLSIYIEDSSVNYIKIWGIDEMEDGSITTDTELKNIWEWLIK